MVLSLPPSSPRSILSTYNLSLSSCFLQSRIFPTRKSQAWKIFNSSERSPVSYLGALVSYCLPFLALGSEGCSYFLVCFFSSLTSCDAADILYLAYKSGNGEVDLGLPRAVSSLKIS